MPRHYALACAGIAVWILAGSASAQGQPSSASAPSRGTNELAEAALDILQFKCSQCHGPQAARPPKGFGYVMDAPRLIQSGKVVPGNPEASPLFKMISSVKMPPATARNGGLSPQQVEVIRSWIAAGAPAGSARPLSATSPASAPAGAGGAEEFQGWTGRIGKFHVQFVHFPIALLLAGLLAEVLNRVRPSPQRKQCARFLLWLGAIGAALAAGTGWLLSLSREWSPLEEELLEPHEWLGTATAALAAGMVVLGWVLLRRGSKSAWLYFAGIVALGILVSLAGHYGGLLVWGADFFNW